MLVLGLQGSPRKKGNTSFLLSAFLKEAERVGARSHVVDVCNKDIVPCKEYIVCEKKGYCPIDDDMTNQIYPLLRQADVIVAATPVFFYNVTAQLKALIDRSQTLWARKYKLNLTDPGRNSRRGYLLSVGATKGKNLFEGLHLTAKYFFDAVGAVYTGSLTYKHIENIGDMKRHPTVLKDVEEAVADLLKPLLGRKVILFAGSKNDCRSQIASAFTQFFASDRIEAVSGGSEPAEKVNPLMVDVMKEKGIDMGFRNPMSVTGALPKQPLDWVINMGDDFSQSITAADQENWNIPDSSGKNIDIIRAVRDKIEKKVRTLIDKL